MEYLIFAAFVVLGAAVGFFIGVLVGTERMRSAIESGSVGHLRIDRSEPDEPPRPFLEITKGTSIESIAEKDVVILKVINENYISPN